MMVKGGVDFLECSVFEMMVSDGDQLPHLPIEGASVEASHYQAAGLEIIGFEGGFLHRSVEGGPVDCFDDLWEVAWPGQAHLVLVGSI